MLVFDFLSAKHLRFGNVGGDNSAYRKQLVCQCKDCAVVYKPRSAGCDHYRVNNDIFRAVLFELLRCDINKSGV